MRTLLIAGMRPPVIKFAKTIRIAIARKRPFGLASMSIVNRLHLNGMAAFSETQKSSMFFGFSHDFVSSSFMSAACSPLSLTLGLALLLSPHTLFVSLANHRIQPLQVNRTNLARPPAFGTLPVVNPGKIVILLVRTELLMKFARGKSPKISG